MKSLHYIQKISPGFYKVFRIDFSGDPRDDNCVGWLTAQKDGSFNCTSGGKVIGSLSSIYDVSSVKALDDIFSVI